jgi:excisionase family DNA binding protein
MPEIKGNQVYTREEAEALLKISQSTMMRLIKKGVIRAAKIGGQYRILGTELLRQFRELESRSGSEDRP